MNVPDRRGLNLGVVLVALGLFFLLRHELHFSGPGPILLVIGAILFTLSALRGFRGPVVPGCVLLGLGAAFLLRGPLEGWMPTWATILLGIGGGLLLASAIERQAGNRPAPLVPGIVLVTIAVVASLSRVVSLRFPENLIETIWSFWPWALVLAGVILVIQGMRRRA